MGAAVDGRRMLRRLIVFVAAAVVAVAVIGFGSTARANAQPAPIDGIPTNCPSIDIGVTDFVRFAVDPDSSGLHAVAVPACPSPRSIPAKAAADWGRREGSLASPSSTVLASLGGTPDAAAEMGSGSALTCASAVATGDSIANGGRPVSIS